MAWEQDWMVALRAGLAGQRLRTLVEKLGSIAGVLNADSGLLRDAGLGEEQIRLLRRPDESRLAADQGWLDEPGHHLIVFTDPDYPALLRDIPSPPVALFLAGDPSVLWRPQIAVVGSRNPTSGGLAHARDFASELCGLGLVITSGLARGIDAAAHEAALDQGTQTIAVLGTGPDEVYPTRNRPLAKRIRAHGALVTELPPGTPARRQHFPSRNRIISGLSLGVLVIEAGLNSGSLITARLAAEQGREAFALPGSLHNPMAKGCHRLIKQGARLVESTADIMEILAPLAGGLARHLQSVDNPVSPASSPEAGAGVTLLEDEDYARLWTAIGHDPVPVDDLVSRTGLEARAISSMLLMMEMQGLVEFCVGGRIARCA